MPGIAGIKIKIMPTSPSVDLEKIKQEAQSIVESKKGKNREYEEEPIAFGLKALISGFALDESKEIDPIQEKITALDNVKSAEVSDFRRAFG